MNTSISVEFQQDDFSAVPFFSVDTPPLFPNFAEQSQDVNLVAYDPYTSLIDSTDQEAGWEPIRVFSILSSKHLTQYDWAPSVSISYGSDYYQEGEVSDRSNLSDYFRSIATVFRDESSPSKNDVSRVNKSIIFSLLASSSFSEFLRKTDETSLNAVSRGCFSILSNFLLSQSFSQSEEYKDVFGDRVVDYFRGVERVTCVISTTHVQILSFINNNIQDKTFELTSAKHNILEYLEGIFEC